MHPKDLQRPTYHLYVLPERCPDAHKDRQCIYMQPLCINSLMHSALGSAPVYFSPLPLSRHFERVHRNCDSGCPGGPF